MLKVVSDGMPFPPVGGLMIVEETMEVLAGSFPIAVDD